MTEWAASPVLKRNSLLIVLSSKHTQPQDKPLDMYTSVHSQASLKTQLCFYDTTSSSNFCSICPLFLIFSSLRFSPFSFFPPQPSLRHSESDSSALWKAVFRSHSFHYLGNPNVQTLLLMTTNRTVTVKHMPCCLCRSGHEPV